MLPYLEPLRQVSGSDFIVLIGEVAAFQLTGLLSRRCSWLLRFLVVFLGGALDLTLSLIVLILMPLPPSSSSYSLYFSNSLSDQVHTKNLLGFLQSPAGDKGELAEF